MQKQTTQLTSKQWVDQMLREHYEKARQAKAEGRLVCWSTSIAPQELLTTMDIVTMYPENHAAAIGARRDTSPSSPTRSGRAIPPTCALTPG